MATVDIRCPDVPSDHVTLGRRPSVRKNRRTVYDGSAHSQAVISKRSSIGTESDPPSADDSAERMSDHPNQLTPDLSQRSSSDRVEGDGCEKASFFLDILSQAGTNELRRLKVEIVDGKLILIGRVTSFYHKQLAQESLRPFAIGMEIDNQIKVFS